MALWHPLTFWCKFFYKLQQGKTEKAMLYVTWLEGALNTVQLEYLMMLSASEVQKHLRDWLFHGPYRQLQDSMLYLYNDMRITYPKLVTVA